MSDHRDYEVSDDAARIDRDWVYAMLRASYWGGALTREVFERSVAGSLCVGAYRGGAQIGFARAITDRATMAWLSDVIVADAARGQGVGRALTRALLDHPELRGLRRWNLNTRDAHGVYAALGFSALKDPGGYMERVDPTYAAAVASG